MERTPSQGDPLNPHPRLGPPTTGRSRCQLPDRPPVASVTASCGRIASTGGPGIWAMAPRSGDRLASIGTCLAIQASILLLGSWLLSLYPEQQRPLDGGLAAPPSLWT